MSDIGYENWRPRSVLIHTTQNRHVDRHLPTVTIQISHKSSVQATYTGLTPFGTLNR